MEKSSGKGRRSFLRKSALTGTAMALAGAGTAQAKRPAFKRKSPTSPELLSVGILTTTGGHIKSIWGPLINPTGGKTRVTGMSMTHAWDTNQESLDSFCSTYHAEKVARYDGMIDKVDGVIMADFQSLHWNHDLVRPYLEAQVPIFINRPFASSLKNARDMIETARRYNTPIMCGSSLEYVQAVDSVRQNLSELGELTGYVADNAMSDYATHGVHGIYFVYACVGGGVKSVSYQASDWTRPNGVMTFQYAGRDGGADFWGALQQAYRSGSAWIKVCGRGSTQRRDGYRNDVSFERQMDWPREGRGPVVDSAIWLPMIHAMQRMFETGEMPEPYENIYEKTQMFIGGFYSLLEKNGAPVKLEDVPLDWEVPIDRRPMNAERFQDGYFD
ncbi:Gfo/Idh/MocA family oxidoreductase [Candidatus Latescibacterota bacterium]